MPTVPISYKEEYKKVERYCAFQEKCAFDVHRKLRDMEVPRAESEQIILVLTEKGFIDHDRYCDAFVNDHIKIKRWGRQKIKASLKAKSLPAISIDRALNKIEFSILSENLTYLMNRKIIELAGEKDLQKQKAKLIRYLASCGYEIPMILDFID